MIINSCKSYIDKGSNQIHLAKSNSNIEMKVSFTAYKKYAGDLLENVLEKKLLDNSTMVNYLLDTRVMAMLNTAPDGKLSKVRENIKKYLLENNISHKHYSLISDYFGLGESRGPKNIVTIARENNLSPGTIKYKINKILSTIQVNENKLSKNTQAFIENFKQTYNPKNKDNLENLLGLKSLKTINYKGNISIGAKKRIDEVISVFAPLGFTKAEIINAGVVEDALLYQNPQLTLKNIFEFLDNFKKDGLTIDDYRPKLLSSPHLFCYAPKTVTKHVKINRFALINKYYDNDKPIPEPRDIILKAIKPALTDSDNYLYLRLLNTKIFGSMHKPKLPASYLTENLKKFLVENPVGYSFNVVEDECADEFIKFAEKFSTDTVGKNLFKINKVQIK